MISPPTYSDFLDSWDGFVTEVPPLPDQLSGLIAYAEGLQGRPLSVKEHVAFRLQQLSLLFVNSRRRGPSASLRLLASHIRRLWRLPSPIPSHSKATTPRFHPTPIAPGCWLL